MVLICYFIKILLYEEEVYEHRMKHRQILELESWARLEPPGALVGGGGGLVGRIGILTRYKRLETAENRTKYFLPLKKRETVRERKKPPLVHSEHWRIFKNPLLLHQPTQLNLYRYSLFLEFRGKRKKSKIKSRRIHG